MSRGRSGILKALKEVFREVKFFGDSEIASLRSDLQNHKQQLEALKAARAERARREEQLALLEMRKAVERLQRMEGMLAEQDEALEAAAEQIAKQASATQEADMTARALRAAHGIDMKDALIGEEAALRQQLALLKEELEAAGRGVPGPLGSEAALNEQPPAGGSSGGKKKRR